MRMKAHDRYQNDPIFARITDVLRMMLETDDEYSGRQFTPTEMREAAMLACEMYEYRHVRPIFYTERAPSLLSMFGESANTVPKTATGSNLSVEPEKGRHQGS